jgi:hypothetical protein
LCSRSHWVSVAVCPMALRSAVGDCDTPRCVRLVKKVMIFFVIRTQFSVFKKKKKGWETEKRDKTSCFFSVFTYFRIDVCARSLGAFSPRINCILSDCVAFYFFIIFFFIRRCRHGRLVFEMSQVTRAANGDGVKYIFIL